MDMDLLIELAVKAVKSYLISEGIPVETAPKTPKRWALVLTEDHCGDFCSKEKFESDSCGITCALMENYDVDIDCYDTVVLYDMTNANLFKLANGCTDSKFLSLAAEAILKGKRVLMVKDDVEILKYEDSPAKALYANIYKNLQILLDSGVTLIARSDVKAALEQGGTEPAKAEAPAKAEVKTEAKADAPVNAPIQAPKKAPEDDSIYEITKKVITERDIKEAAAHHAKKIKLPVKPLITSLALDTARDLDIELI